jgi:uncharacterized Fe-S cluster-containing MiaB family protein
MIKEIQEIIEEMITLNNRVYGAILSTQDLQVLANSIDIMKNIQKVMDHLFLESKYIPNSDLNQLIKVLSNIHELASQLEIAIDQIYALSTKFIGNYEKEWEIIHKNVA